MLLVERKFTCSYNYLTSTLPSFRGIEPSSSAVDIKKAYRKAALRHHPDKVLYYFLSIVTLIVLLSNSSYATGQYISCQE